MPLFVPHQFKSSGGPVMYGGLIAGLTVIATLHFVRAVGNPSPIYGGDEYAYFASGLHRAHLAELWQRDPYLQQILNPLFLALIDWSSRLFPDPAAVIRVMGASGFLAMTALAGLYVARSAGGRHAVALLLLVTLLPSAGFASAVMPEALFYATAVLAVLSMSKRSIDHYWAGAIAGGAFTAAAFLLKPHAISLFLGIVAAKIFLAAMLLGLRQRWQETAASTLVYIVSTYAFMVLLCFAVFKTVQLDPRALLGNFYVSAAQTTLGVAAVGGVARYALANAAGLLLLTFPFVGIMALRMLAMVRQRRSDARLDMDFAHLVTITAAVAAATLLMVAMFTQATGSLIPSEAFRLHGRYYAHLFILIAVGALSVRNWPAVLAQPLLRRNLPWLDGYRAIGIGWLVSGPVMLLAVWQFQILPWDNPELQAFYRSSLAVWQSPVHVAWFAAVAPALLAVAALTLLLRSRLASIAVIGAVALVFAMSAFNNMRFQQFQIAGTRHLTEAGRFVRDQFPPGADDTVVVVGSDRYGAMAYALFGMSCRCHVLQVDEGKQLARENLRAGIRLIFAVRSLPIAFPTEVLFKAPAGSLHRVID